MSVRIQVILKGEEKELLRRQAKKEGMSLSAWLRRAGLEKARGEKRRKLGTMEDLRRFFRECEAREKGDEPSWEEHLSVIRRSRRPEAGS